ncbi:MAG: hypothetical protein RRZ68_03580, partial [Oscillospiraceae bacterium]
VPNSVVKRARTILEGLEKDGLPVIIKTKPEMIDEDEIQLSFGSNNNDEIVEELKKLDVNTLTPIEAMSRLYELSEKAKQ